MSKSAPKIGQKPYKAGNGIAYRKRNIPLAPIVAKAKLGALSPLNLFAASPKQEYNLLAINGPAVGKQEEEGAPKQKRPSRDDLGSLRHQLNPERSFYTSKGKLIKYKVIYSKSKDTRARKCQIQKKSRRVKEAGISQQSTTSSIGKSDLGLQESRQTAFSSIFEFLK